MIIKIKEFLKKKKTKTYSSVNDPYHVVHYIPST